MFGGGSVLCLLVASVAIVFFLTSGCKIKTNTYFGKFSAMSPKICVIYFITTSLGRFSVDNSEVSMIHNSTRSTGNKIYTVWTFIIMISSPNE